MARVPKVRRQVLVLSPFFVALPLVAAGAEDLTLRRVMLSTGGVGYFEYEATVDGDADLQLPVRLDQVDDVMKSIVVYDDRGGIGQISLPGQEPLREVFRELPFTPDALTSPVGLLNALRGSEVRAQGARVVVGRILSVTEETVQLPNNGGTVTQHRLSLLTADGVRQVILEETDTLEFTDADLQAQIGDALAALAEHGQRDRRTLTVDLSGSGERTVRVAYVVEVPLWKATYRLTMSDDPDVRTADAQGWAVLENLSGEDWNGVELSVVSGNPVTFRQALYNAYYVSRPEVPVEVLGRVLPQVDQGALQYEDYYSGVVAQTAPPPPPPAPAMAQYDMMARGAGNYYDQGYGASAYESVPYAAPAPGEAARLQAADSTEANTQVVFRLPEPVTLASGESVLVPIVSRTVPVERLSLFQPSTHPTNPLATVRLSNDGESGLPPGVLTLYERSEATGIVSYLGDAQLNAFPAGEERLISFAVDQKVRVDQETASSNVISRGSIVDGVLRLTLTERQTTTYTISGAAQEKRTVVLEHPRYENWELTQPALPDIEATPDRYRIPVEVPAGETVTVQATQEHPIYQQVELLTMTAGQIQYYAAAGELTEEVRQAIARLSEYAAGIAEAQRVLSTLEAEQRRVTADQQRIRANLESVPRDSDLYQRYLTGLSADEDRLEGLETELAEARDALEQAQAAMRDYARGLQI